VTTSADKTVRFWDYRQKQCAGVLTGHSDPVWTCAVSCDGVTVASACGALEQKVWDRNIRLWDLRTFKMTRSLNGHSNWVSSLAFSPDGTVLASGSEDTNVALWHLRAHSSPSHMSGHTGRVNVVTFSSDGVLLASASEDKTVRLYDMRTRELVAAFKPHRAAVRVAKFSPDSHTLTTASPDKSAKLVITTPYRFSIQLPSTTQSTTTSKKSMRTSRSRASTPQVPIIREKLQYGTFVEIPYKTLETATNSWSEANKLGLGGFGGVYKGILDDIPIAVKRLEVGGEQGAREFLAEIGVLSKYRHRCIVSLLGSSVDGASLCLVYELMPGGSVSDLLAKCRRNETKFSWIDRVMIALDAAQGLEYVHSAQPYPLLHLDFKAANVLLSCVPGPQRAHAKVGDFGLAQFMNKTGDSHATHVTMTRLAGTSAYIDPAYEQSGQAAPSSDVYSFVCDVLIVLWLLIIAGSNAFGVVDQ